MSGYDLHLPSEICTQILTKLPVKSLLRFRCVCKTWYSLISSPNFISDHTTQTLNQTTGDRGLLECRHTGIGIFTFRDKSTVESHDVPEQLRSPFVEIVGSCNGLICLSRYDHRVIGADGTTTSVHGFMIWNPSIRKLVELPLLLYPPSSHSLEYLSGFGFDSESRDYKVLRVVYRPRYGHGQVWGEFDIFDLRKGVYWRSSSSLMWPRYVYRTSESVSLYGNLHWIGSDDTLGNYILVCFNLSTEVLHEMEMLVPINKDNGYGESYIESYATLAPINGLLSLAVVKDTQEGDVSQFCVSVWSMKEYGVNESWTKLFNIELLGTMKWYSLEQFWENGEVLLVERVEGNKLGEGGRNVLVLYNYESEKSEALLSSDEVISRAYFYKESLVLL